MTNRTVLAAPPGVTVMTVGEARREFPDHVIGPPLRAWGDSPAVPRDPDEHWCWVLEGGIEIRCRFKTQEEAIANAWKILWFAYERRRDEPERAREIEEFKKQFLQERGWGFPEGFKADCRSRVRRKKGKEKQ